MESEKINNTELENKKEDLEYLVNKLEEIHPDPYRNINQEKEVFTNSLNKSLEVEKESFPIAIQESLALLQDLHTSVRGFQKKTLPIEFLEFEKSFHIVATEEKNKEHIGEKVKSINNFNLDKINNEISKLSTKENNETLIRDLQSFLANIKILRYYKFCNSENIEIATEKNKFNIQQSKDFVLLGNHPLKNWDKNTYEGNKTYRFKTINHSLLFQYNACNNREHTLEELNNFKQKLLNKSKDVKNIIVDLRLNGGGDTRIMDDLFKKLPENKNFYVASSRETLSSGIHHLIDLKKNKNAIIIGENTGQKANRFGYGETFKLPNSEIKIMCSQKYYELEPGKEEDIMQPDIKIPVTIEDYKNNTDPVIQWIKENLN